MIRNIICVTCPMGCSLVAELNEQGEVISVSGNTCKRGETYAINECINPVRSLTTTVRVEDGLYNVVPCKSASPLPKEKIFDCMKVINSTCSKAPVAIGDVLVANVCETGIDIVATNHNPTK